MGDVCGWYGTGAILFAYALVSFSFVPANGFVYQLLNLSGAFGLIVLAITKNVFQSVVLNLVWAVVALLGMVRLFLS